MALLTQSSGRWLEIITRGWRWLAAGICIGWLAACQSQPSVAVPTPLAVAVVPTGTPTAVLTATPLSTVTPTPLRLAAAAAVPLTLVQAAQAVAEQYPASFVWSQAETADILLSLNGPEPVAKWWYAVVAPFPTITDTVTLTDLQRRWQAGQLYVDEATAAFLGELWGESVSVAVVADVAATLWTNRPSLGLLPFDKLTPDLKVLAVDGLSPLTADFNAAAYPLQMSVGLSGDQAAVSQFLSVWPALSTNRDPDKLTRVAMTGVTALTRATAFQMEIGGLLSPGTAVAPVLQTADIAHVSNEVSFSPDCPYPDPVGGTSFCSRDSYFELLKHLEIDVVELTGNHLNDYGTANLAHTLELYDAAGMLTFGGGRDAEAAREPAFFTHNGNRLAFLGCNPVGPAYDWATATQPGSRPCDHTFYTQISQLQADGYVVIATLQYHEYYQYTAAAAQQADFEAVAAAGATAVSGSQGHHAQGFEFHNDAFIHYGLGNLFFDQMDMLGTRQTFIDTYVIYDGRLLSVTLWTGLIENWCCPRDMTTTEREGALMAVFQASGW